MSSSNLIRWSGLAAMVGGVLWVILPVVFLVSFGDQPGSVAASTTTWTLVHIFDLLASILIFLGLVGLYARQAEKAGALGLIAFLIAFTGTAMMFSESWANNFVVPVLAEATPELVDTAVTALPGTLKVGFMLTFGLFGLGWLLFGLASLQASVLPRGPAILLMVGAVLVTVLFLALELPFGFVVFGAALAWMGYALWSGTGEPALPIAEAAA